MQSLKPELHDLVNSFIQNGLWELLLFLFTVLVVRIWGYLKSLKPKTPPKGRFWWTSEWLRIVRWICGGMGCLTASIALEMELATDIWWKHFLAWLIFVPVIVLIAAAFAADLRRHDPNSGPKMNKLMQITDRITLIVLLVWFLWWNVRREYFDPDVVDMRRLVVARQARENPLPPTIEEQKKLKEALEDFGPLRLLAEQDKELDAGMEALRKANAATNPSDREKYMEEARRLRQSIIARRVKINAATLPATHPTTRPIN